MTPQDAYDLIDRFLRNNLYDDDYATFSEALDVLRSHEESLECPLCALNTVTNSSVV